MPVCSTELDHSTSRGGNVTLNLLEFDPGYWRATSTSKVVLACYNEDACLGGITGADGYCRQGYEGPCMSKKPSETSYVDDDTFLIQRVKPLVQISFDELMTVDNA